MGYPGDQQPPPPSGMRGVSPYGSASPYASPPDGTPGTGTSSYGVAAPYGSASPHGVPRENPYGRPYESTRDSAFVSPQESRQEHGGSAPFAARQQQPERPSAPTVPPRSEPEWDPYAPAPMWRRPIVLGGALLALIGALFLGLWVAARNEKPPAPRVLPTPTPLVPEGPKGAYGYAGSRATDKMPLTARELFGAKKFSNKRRTYVMTVRRTEKTCADGVSGSKIAKALKAGGCTQLIRASFADAKGTIIGTVGVANLKTSAHAKKVTSAGGGKERTDYLKPLPGQDEATKHLGGAGNAYAGGWAYGHYAVLLWFQFKDGHEPSKSELKRLYQAASDITDKTVFPALEHRSLTGTRMPTSRS